MQAYAHPLDLALAQGVLDQRLAELADKYVVKLRCFDQSGNVMNEGSGFLYTDQEPLIITCAHVVANAHRVEATYQGSTTQTVVQTGAALPGVDLTLLRGQHKPAAVLYMSLPALAMTSYAVGYPPQQGHLRFSKGIVAGMDGLSLVTDAHADSGWSGGPLLSVQGRVLGVITGSEGNTIHQPKALAVGVLQTYLQVSNAPLLAHT